MEQSMKVGIKSKLLTKNQLKAFINFEIKR